MAKAARNFHYQQRTEKDIKDRANQRGGTFDSYVKPQFKMFKPKDGKNIVRILPPTWENAKHYGLDIFVNYGIGVDNQSYLSLSRMMNKPDPIAQARKEAEREGDEETAKALRANQRILMWVIDREAEDEGPQWWASPMTVDKALANLSFDEDTKEVLFIDDPDNGYDLRFYKEGEGLKTKYPPEKMKLLPRPLSEDAALANDWLDFVSANPLPEILNFYEYEHIASVFSGTTSPKAAKEEEPEPAPRRTARPARQPEPETEVEDEPLPEDEPPKQVSRRARPVPADDEVEAAPEPPSKSGQSIRDRLRARRSSVPADED